MILDHESAKERSHLAIQDNKAKLALAQEEIRGDGARLTRVEALLKKESRP